MTKNFDGEKASILRQCFVRDVKINDTNSGIYSVSVVERDKAQAAFVNWTYHQITKWAETNGLVVDFGKEGSLILFDVRALHGPEGT